MYCSRSRLREMAYFASGALVATAVGGFLGLEEVRLTEERWSSKLENSREAHCGVDGGFEGGPRPKGVGIEP